MINLKDIVSLRKKLCILDVNMTKSFEVAKM